MSDLNKNKKSIIILGASGGNNAINGLMFELVKIFSLYGLQSYYFDIGKKGWDSSKLLKLLESGNILFVFSYLGIGQDIKITTNVGDRNLWEFLNIPFIKIQGDLPAYLPIRHISVPKTSINMYPFEEFLHYYNHWIATEEQNKIISLAIKLPLLHHSDASINTIDFQKRRQGKLVFLKTGGSPILLMKHWEKNLPHSIYQLLCSLCEELQHKVFTSSITYIDDLIIDFLEKNGFSNKIPNRLFHLLCAEFDDYTRRIKANIVAESLLDFPVIIQGGRWGHLDFSKAKATHLPPINYDKTEEIYKNQLGMIDISPNVNSGPHERILRAVGTYSIGLTNKQHWLTEKFPNFQSLNFEFTKESIQTRINDVLTRPKYYQDMAVSFSDEMRRIWPIEKACEQYVGVAEIANFTYQNRGIGRLDA